MKLREYLEQFKDLDPELEVFDQHPDFFNIDKVNGKYVRIVYVKDPSENCCEFSREPKGLLNKKVVQL